MSNEREASDGQGARGAPARHAMMRWRRPCCEWGGGGAYQEKPRFDQSLCGADDILGREVVLYSMYLLCYSVQDTILMFC